MRYINKSNSGLTLVEILIYMALVSITATALYSILIANIRASDSIEKKLVMNQDMRAAIELMSRDIRQAGCNPREAIGMGFQTDGTETLDTDTDSIHFLSDTNGDSDATDVGEDIAYYLKEDIATGSDTLIRRARYDATSGLIREEPLLENILKLEFEYHDINDQPFVPDASTFDDIYFVQITLQARTAKRAATTKDYKTHEIVTLVRLRNAGL